MAWVWMWQYVAQLVHMQRTLIRRKEYGCSNRQPVAIAPTGVPCGPEHVMGLTVLQVRHKIVYGRSRAFSVGLEPPESGPPLAATFTKPRTKIREMAYSYLSESRRTSLPSQLVDKPLLGREPLVEVGKVSVKSVVASRSQSNTAHTSASPNYQTSPETSDMWLEMTTGAKQLWLAVFMSRISLSAVAPTEQTPVELLRDLPVSGPTTLVRCVSICLFAHWPYQYAISPNCRI